jgi:hypothetical protein
MAFKFNTVDQAELTERLQRSSPRGRTSKGASMIEEFLSSGQVAATVDLGSTKERNAVAISASNHTRNSGAQVWIKKEGGGTGTELLLINLGKANAETKKAYENRPRVGRRPKS